MPRQPSSGVRDSAQCLPSPPMSHVPPAEQPKHEVTIEVGFANNEWFANREGCPDGLYGVGRTPIAALADLLEKEMGPGQFAA